jgi:hypothetical protein
MQKILTFIITAFVLFAIVKSKLFDFSGINFMSFNSDVEPAKDKVISSEEFKEQYLEGNFWEKSISKIVTNVLATPQGKSFFENLIKPINNNMDGSQILIGPANDTILKSTLMINDVIKNTTIPVCCGEKVRAQYKLYLPNKEIIEKDNDFILGLSEFGGTFDSAIVGMTAGGKRTFILKAIEPKAALKNFDSAQVEISLLNFDNIIDQSKVKIFDESFSYTVPLLCGDKISFDLKITQPNGEELLKDHNISMQLGDSDQFPIIFSYSLFNKTAGGSRVVLTPAKYLDNFLTKLDIRHINEADYLLLEFSNINNITLNDNIAKLQKSKIAPKVPTATQPMNGINNKND